MADDERFEQKFILSDHYIGPVSDILVHALVPDRRYPEDTVASIYFDSIELKAFGEVMEGDIVKEKLRLRWYESSEGCAGGGAAEVPAWLERKMKEGFRGKKERVKIAIPGSVIDDPMREENFLTDEFRGALAELGWSREAHFSPALLIRYKRQRFFDPSSGLRIALDSDLIVTHVNPRLMPLSEPVKVGKAVLEVKGELYKWPENLKMLEHFPLRSGSFSKYACALDACRFRPELVGKWI